MFQTYSLTRTWDGEGLPFAQTFTVSDDDAINCAHMLAAGFNTMSRNFMNGFVLGVVDTTGETVQYDGKSEQIKRDAPWFSEQTITFNPTAGDADTILTLFGNGETPTFTAAGKFSFVENATDDEVMTKAADDLAKASYGHIARSVLEDAYAELQEVKEVLYNAGCETIPADVGVKDLSAALRARDGQIAELVQQRANQNAAARDELIEFTRSSYEKLRKVDPEGAREDLQNRYRGMLDVLANLLVAIGEADRDERHAVARRLVETGE